MGKNSVAMRLVLILLLIDSSVGSGSMVVSA